MSVVVPPVSVPSSTRSQEFRLGYKLSLDGLRGFAVLVVMAHHAFLPFCEGGKVGVDIFFVLSGFLITSLLLEEQRKTNGISLRNFYIRRILRLIPALAVLLLFVQCYSLIWLRGARFWQTEKAILAVIFYSANWIRAYRLGGLSHLGHAWSLSIEEQFYLIWPFAFAFLLRNGKSQAAILKLLGLAILVVWLRRLLLWHGITSLDRIYFGGDTRSDELLAGCALAIWLHMKDFPWRTVQGSIAYLAIPALLLIAGLVVHPPPASIICTLEWPVLEVAVCILILRLVASDVGPLQRALEVRPIVWVGKLSYGLYLWHFPILAKALAWKPLGAFAPMVGLILSFAAATASYYFVEARFLKRKREFVTNPK
jgi:peptidoglycan/LPS O-acetylase OafA/YrhL